MTGRRIRLGAAIALALGLAVGGSGPAAAESASDLGVEVLGVIPSSAGYMLAFRFRLIDRVKAQPLLDQKIEPKLVDEQRTRELMVPQDEKVGRLRQIPKVPKAGQTLSFIFANPGRALKAGDHVSLVLGEHEIPDLTIGEYLGPVLGGTKRVVTK